MRIAIDTNFLGKNEFDEHRLYAEELLMHFILQHSEYTFIFLFDKPIASKFNEVSNIEKVIISPSFKKSLAGRYWYDLKLAAALKKIKADIFIGFDGLACLATKLPQMIVLQDASLLPQSKKRKKIDAWFYKMYQQKFINKSKFVVTSNECIGKTILEHYTLKADKVKLIEPAASQNFVQLNGVERSAAIELFTQGPEYFLCIANNDEQNMLQVLKAFSIFKKWQKSSMKLIIAGEFSESSLLAKIETYKHRNDVIIQYQFSYNQFPKLLAAAYAVICTSSLQSRELMILNAMQSGIPVITSNVLNVSSIFETTALYASANAMDEIANHMQKLYKDETYRKQLIQKGSLLTTKFSWQKAVEKLFGLIDASA
jgi:glycosyltransferase involved in cell wall biosynthesis